MEWELSYLIFFFFDGDRVNTGLEELSSPESIFSIVLTCSIYVNVCIGILKELLKITRKITNMSCTNWWLANGLKMNGRDAMCFAETFSWLDASLWTSQIVDLSECKFESDEEVFYWKKWFTAKYFATTAPHSLVTTTTCHVTLVTHALALQYLQSVQDNHWVTPGTNVMRPGWPSPAPPRLWQLDILFCLFQYKWIWESI